MALDIEFILCFLNNSDSGKDRDKIIDFPVFDFLMQECSNFEESQQNVTYAP